MGWAKRKYKSYKQKAGRYCPDWLRGPWWFQLPQPIDRFTGWLVVYTAALGGIAFLQTCSLNTQDETQRAIQRAFISNELSIAAIESGGTAIAWDIRAIVENNGTTPGKNVRFWGGSQFGMVDKEPSKFPPHYPASYPIEGGGGIEDPDIGYAANIDDIPRIVLGPHAKTDIRWVQVSADDLKKIFLGTWRLSMAATIRYRDIFDGNADHITKFCYVIDALRLPDGTLRAGYHFCPYWNCTDDDCRADTAKYHADAEKVFRRFGKPVPENFYGIPRRPR